MAHFVELNRKYQPAKFHCPRFSGSNFTRAGGKHPSPRLNTLSKCPVLIGLKGHGFHGDNATIFYLTLEYYLLSVLSLKLYFLEIGPVHQTLWLFKCKMLKTMNSNFFD